MLTPKQEMFCKLYVKLNNASEAYRRIYDAGGMKQQTIEKRACELRHNRKIAGRVREIQAAMVDKLNLSPEKVLREYARIGFSDARELLTEDGQLKPVSEWPDELAPAIQNVKARQGKDGATIIEVKFWSKIAALESLAKHLGLFEKDNKQRSTSLAEILKEIDNGGLPAPDQIEEQIQIEGY